MSAPRSEQARPQREQGEDYRPAERLSLWQAAAAVARRDFVAILYSRAFVYFLLGPIFIGVMFALSGALGSQMARQVNEFEAHSRVGLAMSPADNAAMIRAQRNLSAELGDDVPMMEPAMGADKPGFSPAQALEDPRSGYSAIVTGSLAAPALIGSQEELSALSGMVRLTAATAAGNAPARFPPLRTEIMASSADSAAEAKTGRLLTAQAGQTVLFLLTMLLAGMVLSNLVEEKTNKIIEILAAAIPMDAVFMGKLFAMLGVSLVGVAVWGAVGFLGLALSGQTLAALPSPAVGWPIYIALGMIYFVMAYLLLGALFLTIGSLATTVREVQTLSMPVTMLQVAVFLFASFAVSQPGTALEWMAVIIPLSSPYAMFARAAQESGLLQHIIAICYQGGMAVLTIHFGARLFSKRVMQSGPQREGRLEQWWRGIRRARR